MRIGVPKETAAGEHRVALVPEVVGKLKAKGLESSCRAARATDALRARRGLRRGRARELSGDAGEVWRCGRGA